jgi:CrcB protein
MNYLIVGVGGAAGSLTRYGLGKYIMARTRNSFPWGTFFINLSGAILLGIVSSLAISHSLLLLLADGFLGAYTTFSTFMYEGFSLFHGNKKRNAAIYIVVSLLLGLLGYNFGQLIVTISAV